MADTVRAFVAAELPPEVVHHLEDLLRRLRLLKTNAVRWVRAEGIHLTLKFLGDVEAARLPQVQEALEPAVQGQSHFRLRLQGTGTFPSPRSPRVVWVGVNGDIDSLRSLHRRVENALTVLGFPAETRSFSPHLTLGRVRERLSPRDRDTLLSALETLPVDSGLAIEVRGVSLIQSTLLPTGAQYRRLHHVAL